MCSSLGPPSGQTSFTTASMNSKFKLAITDTFSNKSPCQVYDIPNATPSQKEKKKLGRRCTCECISFLSSSHCLLLFSFDCHCCSYSCAISSSSFIHCLFSFLFSLHFFISSKFLFTCVPLFYIYFWARFRQFFS